MGYRNEIYRAEAAAIPAGSVCVPASLQEWQARGWNVFAGIDRAEKTATCPNPKDGSIDGLAYALHSCQEGDGPVAREKILVRIDSWRFTHGGDTTDLPVMEFVFDAAQMTTPAQALESLKIMARPFPLTEKVAMRAVNGALFLINQINAGQVPDFERVLELHRIHPDINLTGRHVTEEQKVHNPSLVTQAANANAPDDAQDKEYRRCD